MLKKIPAEDRELLDTIEGLNPLLVLLAPLGFVLFLIYTNGLLREYFPKHQDIAQYPDDYLEKAVLALNNRPRKCLQWRTPHEVYFDEVLHLV